MTSKTDIMNTALVLLGQPTIADPSDARADQILALYDAQRDFVLSLHPWNCNDTWLSVAADSATPAWGFRYQYSLPSGGDLPFALRVWEVADDPQEKFKIVAGRKLWTDAAPPLKIRFSARVDEEGFLDPVVANVLSHRLAALTAWKYTDSRTRASDLMSDYADALKDARSADGQEGTSIQAPADAFLASRI